MTLVELGCPICHESFKKYIGHVRRADKHGLTVYCGRTCAGIGRRHNKTPEQLKLEKAEYDKQYRYYHRDGIKQRKSEAFKKDYKENPEKYKKDRERKYPKHLEYLRTPEYKAWKKSYDEQYRAKQNFGEFYESAILINRIFGLLPHREIKSDLKQSYTTQKRKRKWKILMQNH